MIIIHQNISNKIYRMKTPESGVTQILPFSKSKCLHPAMRRTLKIVGMPFFLLEGIAKFVDFFGGVLGAENGSSCYEKVSACAD